MKVWPYFVLSALAATSLAAPARATSDMLCGGDGVTLNFIIGSVVHPAPADVDFQIGSAKWASWGQGTGHIPADTTKVRIDQVFYTHDQWMIDIADEHRTRTVAELRLFKVAEGETVVMSGTFRVVGKGAWPVTCEAM
jgi:hypothetical protein